MALPLAAIAALAAAPQAITGILQLLKGYGSDEPDRPEFIIPASTEKALASAKAQAGMMRLPGQGAIEGRLDQTSANTVGMLERTSDSPTSIINSASRVYGNQLDAENRLGIAGAQQHLQNQDIYRNELDKMGEWENRKWAWDKQVPYVQKTQQLAALKEGGIRNLTGASSNIFGSIANFALAKAINPTSSGGGESKILDGNQSGNTVDYTGNAAGISMTPEQQANQDLMYKSLMEKNIYAFQ